jgi:hypothetical protein
LQTRQGGGKQHEEDEEEGGEAALPARGDFAIVAFGGGERGGAGRLKNKKFGKTNKQKNLKKTKPPPSTKKGASERAARPLCGKQMPLPPEATTVSLGLGYIRAH